MTQHDLEQTSRKARIAALAERVAAQAGGQTPEADLAALAREALVAGQALAAARERAAAGQVAAPADAPVYCLTQARARAAIARQAEAEGQARCDRANRPVSGVARQAPPAFIETMKILLRPD